MTADPIEVLRGIEITAEIAKLLEQAEETRFTILHCSLSFPPLLYIGVNIYKTSYLIHGSERLDLLHAINIPYAPERRYLTNVHGYFTFVLIFPHLPAHWETFDFMEQCNTSDGFKASGIKRNESGIYKVVVL